MSHLEDGTVVGVRHVVHRVGDTDPASIARAIFWKLCHLGESISLLAASEHDSAIRIEVSGHIDTSGETIDAYRDRMGFVVEYDDRIQDELGRDSMAVEKRIGMLLAQASSKSLDEQQTFLLSWNVAPSGIAVDRISTPQQARNIAPFVPPHGSFRAGVERSAAEQLMQNATLPGVRRGTDARDLESTRIHPALTEIFRNAADPFNYEAVLQSALENLESIYCERWKSESHNARLASLATSGLMDRVASSRRESTTAWRSLALTVEEVLRNPPTGSATPRFFDLQRIHAAAYNLFESGMRSETLHQAVSGTELEITDGFELLARAVDFDFDFEAFNSACTSITLPTRPAQPDEDGSDIDLDQHQTIVAKLPELAGIDTALQQDLKFGLDALLGVLDTVIQWPVSDRNPIAKVPLSTLLDEAVDGTHSGRSELAAAINWMTLRASDLHGEPLEHWELDRRAVRLATRPLVEISPDQLLLCPWGASTTRGIIGNHLMDGRLPWPQSNLPGAVNKALSAYRATRNIDLERKVIKAFSKHPSLHARGPIKKAKVLGLKVLPREIDGICVDESRSRIWVIEAKDRAVAFSPHQLRNAIDQFHEEDGYIAKVESNVAIISNSAATVATALGISQPDRQWHVIGLMTTRRIEPAAYVAQPRLIFCTVDTIIETIDDDILPDHRYAAINNG